MYGAFTQHVQLNVCKGWKADVALAAYFPTKLRFRLVIVGGTIAPAQKSCIDRFCAHVSYESRSQSLFL